MWWMHKREIIECEIPTKYINLPKFNVSYAEELASSKQNSEDEIKLQFIISKMSFYFL